MTTRKRQRLTRACADADSTMHSSEDEMFPDEALSNNPATPLNAPLQIIGASDISPPDSQNAPRDTLTSAVNANGKRPLSLAAQTANTMKAQQGTHTDKDSGYSWSAQEDQPGFEWRNNRAREEAHRALDSIVDQDSQIKSKPIPLHVGFILMIV
jgi:CHASE2 domain-containing sensor protein